ncbi:MAG: hypothetical protein EOP48_34140 [Sphingobacteriales bacterium]|nr:MAG: hypothetical protein EOP48_34140 [Sphingobacteriales bacterium]
MNKKLHFIREKINAIQSGLVRFQDNDQRVTMHVKATSNDDDTVECFASTDTTMPDLANKRVNLIQKSEDDYLYISGEIKEKMSRNKKVFSMSILKACWFVRKSKGTLTWLQEKHVYDITPQEDISIAS